MEWGVDVNHPDSYLQQMGERIAASRKAKGFTQEQLAEKASVSVGMISTAERGIKALRPENLAKISAALGVSSDYLLTGAVTESELSAIEKKISKLTTEQKNALCAVLAAGIEMLQQ